MTTGRILALRKLAEAVRTAPHVNTEAEPRDTLMARMTEANAPLRAFTEYADLIKPTLTPDERADAHAIVTDLMGFLSANARAATRK